MCIYIYTYIYIPGFGVFPSLRLDRLKLGLKCSGLWIWGASIGLSGQQR